MSAPPTGVRERGLLDRGAIFAGWVGLGVAVVVVISFGLVIAVQPLVWLAAPVSGVLVGSYANHRSARWRPRWRVMANAAWAGLVTGLSLAIFYAAVRLLFIYLDAGYRPESQGGQIACRQGPECVYARYVDEGRGDELAEAGVSDASGFERAMLDEQLAGVLMLSGLTLVGAVGAGVVRAVRRPPGDAPNAVGAGPTVAERVDPPVPSGEGSAARPSGV